MGSVLFMPHSLPFPRPSHEPHPSSHWAVLAQLLFPPIRQLLSLMTCREDIKEGRVEQDLNYESQGLMKSMRSFCSCL